MTKAQRLYREARRTLNKYDARYLVEHMLKMTIEQLEALRN